jgi:hypothetical protein
VAGRTLDLAVSALEGIVRKLLVVESVDLERVGDVTGVTRALGRIETKLPSVNVAVATPALTWRTTVRGPLPALPVLLRGAMATVAGRLRVSAGQRPSAVIDPWRLPASLGVAVSAASVAHLDGKLIAMRVVVAVDATPRPELQVVARSFALVTTRTADRLMFPVQRELGAAVPPHGEQRRPKPVLVMTTRAVGDSQAATMHVSMAVATLLKPQTPISALHRELG